MDDAGKLKLWKAYAEKPTPELREKISLGCTSHISSAHLPRVANGRHIGHPSPDPQGSSQTRVLFMVTHAPERSQRIASCL